jgi:hypothetical protein
MAYIETTGYQTIAASRSIRPSSLRGAGAPSTMSLTDQIYAVPRGRWNTPSPCYGMRRSKICLHYPSSFIYTNISLGFAAELRCNQVFLSWIYSTIQSRCPFWKLGAKSPHTTNQNGQEHIIPIVAYHLEHQSYFDLFCHTPTSVAAKISPRPTNTISLYAVTMACLNNSTRDKLLLLCPTAPAQFQKLCHVLWQGLNRLLG